MELKSKLTIATLICAGMFATGCSQQQAVGSQQTAQHVASAPQPQPQHPQHHPVYHGPAHHGAIHHGPARHGPIHHGPMMPKVPHVKAKGNYRGPVQMDDASRATMQQYQQH